MMKHNEPTSNDNQARKRAAAAYSDAAPSEKVNENAGTHEVEKNGTKQEDELVEAKVEGKSTKSSEGTASADVSASEIEELKSENEKLKYQLAESVDSWQRERADFLNYKRRQERDQVQLRNNITGEIIKRYLVIQDDLELALKNQPKNGDTSVWSDGLALILRKLQGILEAEGIQRMEVENQDFDPNIHEAITLEDSPDHESGQIIEVLQQGYKLGDRILRPARVRVAR